MIIWIIILALVFVYRASKVVRARIQRYNTKMHNQPYLQPFHWTIKTEIGTIEHQICEDSSLRSICVQGDYETFAADNIADKDEYDRRMQFARKAMQKELSQRLGIKP